jgi:hypothetical protein
MTHVEKESAMAREITQNDVRELLSGFVAAIELDQIRVDALPTGSFHHLYSDDLWRTWRSDHIEYVNLLLPTVGAIPPAILEVLTRVARKYRPEIVSEAAVYLLAEAAGGNVVEEEVATAALFFDWLIAFVTDRSEGNWVGGDAPALMMQWIQIADPLRIAQDPECGYGVPSGSVN